MTLSLKDPDGKLSGLQLWINNNKLTETKKSPRSFGDPPEPWLFEYITAGYASNPQNPQQRDLRLRIYSQQRKSLNDPTIDMGRLLLRLYRYNFTNLGLDHAPTVSEGVVDFYLCFGGDSGGEQRFDVDYQRKPSQRVNTIYIYDLPSFTDPTEQLREVAHEYGHATLPPVGGFQKPEDWANGYLGERLYLRWVRNEMLARRFSMDDAMHAPFAGVDDYVKKKVDPIVKAAVEQGPAGTWWGTGPVAMDGFMGLALAVDQFVGARAFSRSLALTDPVDAKSYAKAVAEAVMEKPSWRVLVAPEDVGKKIWLPIGNVIAEGATIAEKSGIWRRLVINSPSYTIRPVR